MKNIFLLVVFSSFCLNSNCQSFIDKNYDCELLNWKYEYIENPTSVDSTLIDVECLIIRDKYKKGISLLNSLIEKNKDNPELYLRKAYFQADKDIFDTLYFNNFRIALELGADTSETLYNTGVYYYNYLISVNDSSSPVKLANTDKINLIDQAEMVVKKAAIHDEKYLSYSYEFLSQSKELKAKIKNEKLNPFSLDDKFDTLLIMSQIMDCGEFGGHIEYIKCFYQNDELKATFWKDDPDCEVEIPKEEFVEYNYKSKPQLISYEALSQYVNHVINIDKKPSMWTNAPTSFWIIKDNDPFFIRDWTGNSKEYELFRDKIFKK